MPPSEGPKVKIGEKQHNLRYTSKALGRVQREMGGDSLMETIQAVSRLSINHIVTMVWAGLQHEEDAPSMSEVEEAVEPPLKPWVDAIVDGVRPWIATDEGDGGKKGGS